MAKLTMLGTGLIGAFYTQTVHGFRSRDRIVNVYSRSGERARAFAVENGIGRWGADLRKAVRDPESEIVVVGLPNDMHKRAVTLAAEAGKSVLCTKPLGRTAAEALEMVRAVEKAGVFAGYLEDLVYTPKTLKALASAKNGAMGRILWTRSRETHPGPHSDWFWDPARSGGGAMIDMGCHCIEIGRSFIGKDKKPLRAFCWGATQVHPIEAEDTAIGLVAYEGGAVSQFEVSWTFRGGMDLRDEVSGTEGTIRLDHFLRTGFEMFTAVGDGGYVAEKAEGQTGWLFPVGDEVHELGYVCMFQDMLDAREGGRAPAETFYDGYIVNAIIDACYKSMGSGRWEAVTLDRRIGNSSIPKKGSREEAGKISRKACGRAREAGSKANQAKRRTEDPDPGFSVIQTERLPDGRVKRILKDR
ncbi:MAG: oxidoreductase domain protein, partial [Candidatus Aminicenantes bacterium]|nr:oxidoreductase domain protein [Candidatus Aminicenantes bacterium]